MKLRTYIMTQLAAGYIIGWYADGSGNDLPSETLVGESERFANAILEATGDNGEEDLNRMEVWGNIVGL